MPAIYKDLVLAGDGSGDREFASASANSDWLMVYIEEAHAQDEWPISSSRYNKGHGPVKVLQPRTAAERANVAETFLERFGVSYGPSARMQVVLDDPAKNNAFEKAYAPWPLRLFVVEDGKMAWIAQPDNCTYDVSLLRNWLVQHHKDASTGAKE